ncbi:MDR family MFS transporter [Paenibacillus aceti]|uniref:Multidrug resistance protein n=1 Tax=Paenibacillus aceti TaxID=1820010 RepID=A0ABQ1W1G7_9BACL|nr:MFS transporter [Paenibacillus aceti]GGG09206.1 multidrug resistance protein [Paenibacillus aceti]
MSLRSWDGNLKIRLTGETLFNLFYWMYFPFLTIYFAEGLGNQTAGILMSIPPLIGVAGGMIGGYLADELGRRPVMIAGVLLQTVMFAFFAGSSSYVMNYLAFIGAGLGKALYRPASDAMVADLVPKQERRQVFATFITANNIGAVVGPAIGAVFFFRYRSELLWGCASIMLFYSILIYLKVRESMPYAKTSPGRGRLKISTIFISQWRGYGVIFRDRNFVLYIVAGVFSIITIMQLDLYLAIYVRNHVPSQPLWSWHDRTLMLGSTEILGWVLGLNGLLFVLGVLPVTKWLKGWKDRDVFVLSCILAGGGMFAVGLTTNIWFLFLLTIIFTFGELVRSPITSNFVSNYAPADIRAQYMAASDLQFTIGRFIAPVTVFLSAWLLPLGVFSVILICALISMVLYIKLYRNI